MKQKRQIINLTQHSTKEKILEYIILNKYMTGTIN